MSDPPTTTDSPTHICARLLLELHALSLHGKGSSLEATAACAAMEQPWNAMTEPEQERLGGLSEDLYTLEDGGAKRVTMAPDERRRWSEEVQAASAAFERGEYDAVLE